ncbi:MAG: hypothetical protein WBL85_06010 [Sedimentisphaerales bacterium]
MKSLRTGSVVLGLALITFAAGTAAADDKVVTYGVSLDYFSKYIWRGQNVDNSSVLQPTISASAYGFTGSIWGNLDMTNRSKTAPDNAGGFSEYDLTLDYTNTIPGIDWLSGSVGTIYYQFPSTELHPTTEIYGGFSLPKVPLTPSFKWFRDIQEIHGSYFQYSIGQTFDKIYVMNENCYCGLLLGASYGWANAAYDRGYFGVNSGQSNDLTLTAGLPFNVYTWTIKPSLNYSTMLGNSIREATNKSDNFWAGLGISTSF